MAKVNLYRNKNIYRQSLFKELLKYKDLIYFLILRGIKSRYAQSILGISWAIIQPLLTALIFTVVFGRIAKIGSNGVPYLVFSFAAILPWTFFANAFSESSLSLVTNAKMLSKVYFPRLVLPISSILSKILDFSISFIVFTLILTYYQIRPNANVIYLPFLLLILLIFTTGMGCFLSALAIRYRDVKHALTFLIQILMYLSPVVYSTYKIPVKFMYFYSLNPLAGIIEGIRSMVSSDTEFPWGIVVPGFIVSCLVFHFGIRFFRKMEYYFADIA